MLNYILKNNDYRLDISIDHNKIIVDSTIQKYLNQLLYAQLVDVYSREKTTKKALNYKSKIPLFINKETLLMCVKSYRLTNSLYINYHSIRDYVTKKNCVIINFISNHSMKICQKQAFFNQIKKCQEILDFLLDKKMVTLI